MYTRLFVNHFELHIVFILQNKMAWAEGVGFVLVNVGLFNI